MIHSSSPLPLLFSLGLSSSPLGHLSMNIFLCMMVMNCSWLTESISSPRIFFMSSLICWQFNSLSPISLTISLSSVMLMLVLSFTRSLNSRGLCWWMGVIFLSISFRYYWNPILDVSGLSQSSFTNSKTMGSNWSQCSAFMVERNFFMSTSSSKRVNQEQNAHSSSLVRQGGSSLGLTLPKRVASLRCITEINGIQTGNLDREHKQQKAVDGY